MPVPPLPNELITLIFEHLWSILSTDPSTGFLVIPRNAPFIFAPFLRVNKTWLRLAAPFWLAHVEAKDRDRAAKAIERYKLSQDVIRSIHFDPEIPLPPTAEDWDEYDDEEEEYNSYDPYAYGGRERQDPEDEFWDEVGREGSKWSGVAGSAGLEQLEMGPRPVLSRRRHTRLHYLLYRNDEEEAARGWPAGKVLFQIWPGGQLPRLRSLRLYLPAGSSIAEARQHSDFANLTQLRLTFLGPLCAADDAPESVANILRTTSDSYPFKRSPPFRNLQVLEIFRLPSNVQHLRDVVVPLLIKPAAATLRHLRLEYALSEPSVTLTALELFKDCNFERLESLHIKGRIVYLTVPPNPFLLDTPALKEVTIQCGMRGTFPVPPPPVQHLTLQSVKLDALARLSQTFSATMSLAPALSLRTVSLEFVETDPKFELEHLDTLRSIASVAEDYGVTLLGSWWPLLSSDPKENELFDPNAPADVLVHGSSGEGDDEDFESGSGGGEESEEEEDESDEDNWTSEDEELDWDAEDDAQFTGLWSDGKRRAYDFSQALSALGQHFPSNEASEAAKVAMSEAAEPFLRAEIGKEKKEGGEGGGAAKAE